MDLTEPNPAATVVDQPDQVFVYGTLLPGQPRWPFLQRWAAGPGVQTSAAADLYDTGLGYPAAVFAPSPKYRGGITHGMRFVLRTSALGEALRTLDEVEGAVLGLYHRVAIRTADDVAAWAYTVGDELTLTGLPDGDWLATQGCRSASGD